jgi:hypothetical protein
MLWMLNRNYLSLQFLFFAVLLMYMYVSIVSICSCTCMNIYEHIYICMCISSSGAAAWRTLFLVNIIYKIAPKSPKSEMLEWKPIFWWHGARKNGFFLPNDGSQN